MSSTAASAPRFSVVLAFSAEQIAAAQGTVECLLRERKRDPAVAFELHLLALRCSGESLKPLRAQLDAGRIESLLELRNSDPVNCVRLLLDRVSSEYAVLLNPGVKCLDGWSALVTEMLTRENPDIAGAHRQMALGGSSHRDTLDQASVTVRLPFVRAHRFPHQGVTAQELFVELYALAQDRAARISVYDATLCEAFGILPSDQRADKERLMVAPVSAPSVPGEAGNSERSADYSAQRALELERSSEFLGAIEIYRRLAEKLPGRADVLFNLGNCLRACGSTAEALRAYERAIAINPGYAEALNNSAALCDSQGDERRAFELYQRALGAYPNHQASLFNLALLLFRRRKFDDARQYLRTCMGEHPNFTPAFLLYSQLEHRDGDATRALLAAGAALAIDPDMHAARVVRGEIMLAHNEWRLGFSEWESRRRLASYNVGGALPEVPEWEGQTLSGKRIFVSNDGTIAQALCVLPYLRTLVELGAQVVFRAGEDLLGLTSQLSGVTPEGALDRADCDFWSPLLSLPQKLLACAPEKFSNRGELLVSQASDLYEARSAAAYKVAVVWSEARIDDAESHGYRARDLLPLFEMPGVESFSLQRQLTEDDARVLGDTALVHHVAPRLNSLSERAAIMRQCDLIVACDGESAALAAVIGRPVVVLSGKCPSWQWSAHGDCSAWFPNAVVIRDNDPQTVVRRASEIVRGYVERRTLRCFDSSRSSL